MIECPAEQCLRQFDSYKALSAHTIHCKFSKQAVAAAAKHYAELDSGTGARKRHKTSLSTAAGDAEEEAEAEAIDFEVSWVTYLHTLSGF